MIPDSGQEERAGSLPAPGLLGGLLAAAIGAALVLGLELVSSGRSALLADFSVVIGLLGLIAVWVVVAGPLLAVTDRGRKTPGLRGRLLAVAPWTLPIIWLALATFVGGQARKFSFGGAGPLVLGLILAASMLLILARSIELRRRYGRFAASPFWLLATALVQGVGRYIPFGLYPVHHAAVALFTLAFVSLAVLEVLPDRRRPSRPMTSLVLWGLVLIAALAHLATLHRGPMSVRALLLSADGLVSTRELGRYLPYRRPEQGGEQGNTFTAGHGIEVARREEGRSRLAGLRPAEPCDVIILSIDAVRRDHTSLQGYARDTTPFLVEFGRSAFEFTDARSASTASFFSLTAMLSGAYPSAISLMKGRDPEYLSEAMSRKGWSTIGYYTDAVFTARPPEWSPPDQRMGFETFRLATEESQEMIPLLLDVIDQQKGPYLLFTHFMDPHFDYDKRPGFDFGDEPIDRYDSELAWVDSQVRRFVDELRARGRLDRTILVITSDHGEAFGEHEALLHGGVPYEEQCRVPLLIRVPFLEGGRKVAGAVSLTSLAPTLIDLLGLPPLRDVEAPSLAYMMLENVEPESLFAVVERPTMFDRATWPSTTAVVRDRWKLMHDRDAGVAKLFDLRSDPGERKDLAGERPEILAQLLDLEAAWRSDRRLLRARDAGLPADLLASVDRLRSGEEGEVEKVASHLDDESQSVRLAAGLAIHDAAVEGRAEAQILVAAGRRRRDPVLSGLGDLLISSAGHRPLMEGDALLDAENPRLRRRAAAALWRMRTEPFLLDRVRERLEVEVDAETRADLLAVVLAHEPATVAMDEVIGLISSLEGSVVERLVFSVLSLTDEELMPWFPQLVFSPDLRVTMSVLESLGARDTEYRRSTLRRFLRISNVTLRRIAIRGLTHFPRSAWKRDLLVDLIRHEPHDEMRILAGIEAMTLDDPEFGPAFLDALATYSVTGMGFGHILATTRPEVLAGWDQRQFDAEGALAAGVTHIVPVDQSGDRGLSARRLLVTLIRDPALPAEDDMLRVHDATGREIFAQKQVEQSAMYFVDFGFFGPEAVTPPLTVTTLSPNRAEAAVFGKMYLTLIPLRTPYQLWPADFDRADDVAVLGRFGPGWDCSLNELDRVHLVAPEGELRLVGKRMPVSSVAIDLVGAAVDLEVELTLNGKSIGRRLVPARTECRLEIGDIDGIYDRWNLNRLIFAVTGASPSFDPVGHPVDGLAVKKVIWR